MATTEEKTKVYIKNMVCDRCIMAVHKTIEDMGLKPVEVKLGSATIEGTINEDQRQELREKLQAIGFELLDDQRQRTIEQIRTAIIELVQYIITTPLSTSLHILARNLDKIILPSLSSFLNMPRRPSSVIIWRCA